MGYKVGKLAEKMKARGMDVAESAAKEAIEAMFEWLEEEAVRSENKVDDMVVGSLGAVKSWALEQADAIDGEEG